ncbi:MAG: AEC family transporter [Pseudomonadota bacterium]
MSLAALLIPLFATIFVGAGARALKLFDAEDARRMSRFVFMIAMPFAGFNFMRVNTLNGDIFIGLAAGYVAGLVIASVAAFLVSRAALGLSIRESGAAVFATTCGNAIFLGIPIATSVEGWAAPFLILVLFEGTLVFATGTALMTWPEGDDTGATGLRTIIRTLRQAIFRALRNPIVIGTLLGLAAALIDAPVPDPFASLFDFLARTAGPLGLFILGLSAADLFLQRQVSNVKGAALLLPIKLALFPAVTAAFVWLFTGDGTATIVAALFTGLPPAVSSIVLASVYRQWIGGVSAVVTVGTVVGLVTLAGYLLVTIPS